MSCGYIVFLQKVKEEPENQVSGRYNLRRRKDQGEERPFEAKGTVPVGFLAATQQTSKTTDLEFGGRIGKRPVMIFKFKLVQGYSSESVLTDR